MVQKPFRHANGLGHAIINSRNRNRRKQRDELGNGSIHDYEEPKQPAWMRLQSVTQERDLEEFLSTAELAGTDFTATKLNVKILHEDQTNPYLLTDEQQKITDERHQTNRRRLTVPRRPKWDESTTPAELDKLEREAFLEWRRGLAELENQDLLLTPFERNLEVWRQLWRVVEMSNIVVQICDARNPLFYRSSDLAEYVDELAEQTGTEKTNLLLINKADMLTLKQRTKWSHYFKSHGIEFAFFSAVASTLDHCLEQSEDPDVHVLSEDELMELFVKNASPDGQSNFHIGLVGYPNVGKSSTINALTGAKKVSVSATPGHTKHFQTIFLTSNVVLCDCPGLVFPNFASTKAELVCNGVLPIDQMREYTGPAGLVAQRISKQRLEKIYGIRIATRPEIDGGTGVPTADEFLGAYAIARGLIRSSRGGRPDESKAARLVLKDYVRGKLLYCVPPPNEDPVEFNQVVMF
ncbi:P-loop containing nucleoside triphosphate hydrolase protein [Lipomyces oligophaga]|uniref:P-loop containing nucleoside triphosphate hydrolase protein n=1 Tax=Lipomyces oligophaga TaxID=45792 RepID=UPI0034CE9CFF